MTELQNRIETALFELIQNAGNKLHVSLLLESESTRQPYNDKPKSRAFLHRTQVVLELVEHDNPYELNDWGEAIVRAEELVGELEKEIFHEKSNPNFYRRIRFRIQNKV